jgi:hypothetical protein
MPGVNKSDVATIWEKVDNPGSDGVSKPIWAQSRSEPISAPTPPDALAPKPSRIPLIQQAALQPSGVQKPKKEKQPNLLFSAR